MISDADAGGGRLGAYVCILRDYRMDLDLIKGRGGDNAPPEGDDVCIIKWSIEDQPHFYSNTP